MDWSYLLTRFDGRISRKTFWIAVAVMAAVEIPAHLLAATIGGQRLGAILDLAFVYPEFAIFTKRANDRNLPIGLIAAFFVLSTLMNLVIVLDWSGTSETPSALFTAVGGAATVFFLVLMMDLGLRRGTNGPNPHGPDPLAPGAGPR